MNDQGFGPLAALFKRIAIQEMGHLERFVEQVLFLKGQVEMVPAGPVEKITDPEATLDKAMAMDEDGIQTYNKAALECAANTDSGSKQLFEQLVGDEESHLDQFEQQRDNIKRFGPNYLALQSFGGKTSEGGPLNGRAFTSENRFDSAGPRTMSIPDVRCQSPAGRTRRC